MFEKIYCPKSDRCKQGKNGFLTYGLPISLVVVELLHRLVKKESWHFSMGSYTREWVITKMNYTFRSHYIMIESHQQNYKTYSGIYNLSAFV
jgi:hypothetical protein